MNVSLFPDLNHLPGFRLSKIELYNWGTFDQTVHSFQPRGESALLVGENGTGKSTLVDALLTLLVRPNTRKYNFASGASKTERDERTYVQGAYDKTVSANGTPQLSYLRPGNRHYSAILASFENKNTDRKFTLCQILYLDSNNKVRKFYAIDERNERGIAADLGNITEGSGVLSTLKQRDFRATESYTQYFEWLRRIVKFRPKAMDMFNQAAWVKDVQQLDSFVRQQMLEKKPFNDKVADLLKHFAVLNEAHRALVEVRQQSELLNPLVKTGNQFQIANELLTAAKDQLDASVLYFEVARVELLGPECERWRHEVKLLAGDVQSQDARLKVQHQEIARIKIDVENAGGRRLRDLPNLIKIEEQHEAAKRKERDRLDALLLKANIDSQAATRPQFLTILQSVDGLKQKAEADRTAANEKLSNLQYELGQLKRSLIESRTELESLEKRKGNMPRRLIHLRDQICQQLGINQADLPFAAELMAVRSEHRQWEASIEQVLNGFGKDLIVTETYYAKVSGFVDGQRLTDHNGRGVRLTYTRVANDDVAAEATSHQITAESRLPVMIKYRDGHPLSAWVRGQVARRFDFLACDSIEQFQAAGGKAMTLNRHTKRNRFHHNKDDRSAVNDRLHFILGWENREKILTLKDAINQQTQRQQQLETEETTLQSASAVATNAISTLDQIAAFADFDAIDNQRHVAEISQLKLELEKLTNSNDQVRQLKTRLETLESELQQLQASRDENAGRKSDLEKQLTQGESLYERSAEAVAAAKNDGQLAKLQPHFEAIQTRLSGDVLTLDNLTTLPNQFRDDQIQEVRRLEDKLTPMRERLVKRMGGFLQKFPKFGTELDSTLSSWPNFLALYQRIENDDLPSLEDRFKKRLNENVLTEVGVMNSHLENERQEIKDRIEEINSGLRQMEWREGTYIRLEPEETRDPEIRQFRLELKACLKGYMQGSNQADEETFLKIQKLVLKLEDDTKTRWREKVVDVRNWFCFSAQESGEGGSYYDGGSGKSGGEKAKLAFLVLVAALVYQYDIQEDQPQSDRFHFVMVDEMFSRTATKFARYALDLFQQFGLQLLMVAPLDAKARVCEPYVGVHAHVVKDADTNRSEIISYQTQTMETQTMDLGSNALSATSTGKNDKPPERQ